MRRIARATFLRRFVIPALLLLLAPVYSAAESPATPAASSSAWKLAQSDPAELIQRALQNELANSYSFRAPVRYRLRKITAESDTTKQIVETSEGAIARLMAIGGRPLSPSQTQQEMDRLHALQNDPAIQAHRRNKEMRDSRRVQKFMRLLPHAFLYRAAGSVQTKDGAMIRLTFEPNPIFSPPDFESRLLTGIHGEVWISPLDLRIASIRARTLKTVNFGWGILGSLYSGSTMQVNQSKTSVCGWQMEHLRLHLEGKELMIKTVHTVVEESATDYQPVPPSWTYRDAVRWLLELPAQSGK
ncbi:MAG: hypothetical protein ABI164_03805 [Acidobacteriaceae bacterium]